ncbi:MAG: hypothetical protein ACPGXI_16690 [Mycobacterium sp.]
MTRLLTPREAEVLRPLWDRRTRYLELAQELEAGISSLARAFGGDTATITATPAGGFSITEPEPDGDD